MLHHPLDNFRDPIRVSGYKDPLAKTSIAVSCNGCLATVEVERSFRNDEQGPIEATLTFPVPTAAVVVDLIATIGERRLSGMAQAKSEARQTFEQAVDEGKAAVLHEEVVKGLHQVSATNIGAGEEIAVTIRYMIPVAFDGDTTPTVLVPTTVADIFGRWNGAEVDEPRTGAVVHRADITAIRNDDGEVLIDGASGPVRDRVLNSSIVVTFPGLEPTSVAGRLADGRRATVTVSAISSRMDEVPLDLDLLVDHSLSMSKKIGDQTRMDRVRGTLRTMSNFREDDRLSLGIFNDTYRHLGEARGAGIVELLARVPAGSGSTDLGNALTQTLHREGRGILVITDGKTYSVDYDEALRGDRRIHVLLVGKDAFDQGISYLAARTGGHVMITSGLKMQEALATAFAATLAPAETDETSGSTRTVILYRNGAEIRVEITTAEEAGERDAVGAFAASVLADRSDEATARDLSVANGIVGAFTSLVLVDTAGAIQSKVPQVRKSELTEMTRGITSAFSPMRSFSQSQGMRSMSPSLESMAWADDQGPLTPPDIQSGRHVFWSLPAPVDSMPDIGLGQVIGIDTSVFVQFDFDQIVIDFASFSVTGIVMADYPSLENHVRAIMSQMNMPEQEALVLALTVAASLQTGRTADRIARRGIATFGQAKFDEAGRLSPTRQAA